MTSTRQLPDQTNLMEELAQRCERASGADRELDYAICEAVHSFLAKNGYKRELGDDGYFSATPAIPGGEKVGPASSYTGSLDAAESLMSPGWTWGHVQRCDRSPGFAALLRPNLTGIGDLDFWTDYVTARAATPALALCAASLRARKGLE